jgi:carbamoyl-phosphate synthase large subunit
VVVQFGGQTPLNLARELAEAGVKILGTSHESIEMAEDRDRFNHMMRKLGIPQPESGMASTFDEAFAIADRIGYPLMIRPSFRVGRSSDGSDPRRRGTGALSGCRGRGLAGSPRAAR